MSSSSSITQYQQRKRRTNTSIKAHFPDYRCVVDRSLKHISAQIIDMKGNVLVAASDIGLSSGKKSEKAFSVGKLLAEKALAKKIDHCVFDRNGFLYHWRVKSLCEGAREWGLTI